MSVPRQFIRCARLFTGLEDQVRHAQTLVVENGLFTHVGPTAAAPQPGPQDTVLDAAAHFVMPGMVDVHTHLVFGNARSEEDIDFWVTPEWRALRGLFFAQHVLAAGYTSIVVPGDAGNSRIHFTRPPSTAMQTRWRSDVTNRSFPSIPTSARNLPNGAKREAPSTNHSGRPDAPSRHVRRSESHAATMTTPFRTSRSFGSKRGSSACWKPPAPVRSSI